ncbi:MAG: MFS-type transporter involved in bile tolerance, Atg22 family [Chloroflexi bacterium]|jgi:UMF1 family MFS transporter|nr:MAG: MFS-type transporter involved in bile tolerance, Atg22 family [Chloroflexota bacterium]
MSNKFLDKPNRSAIFSWWLYDFSTTAFFTSTVGLLFPLWIRDDMGGNDATITYTWAVAMLINVMLGPIFGALSDNAKRRMPLLTVFSLVGIGTSFLIGTFDSMFISIILYVIGLIALHTAVVIYNSLLPDVSDKNNRGFITGVGVGVGYVGSLTTILLAIFVIDDTWGLGMGYVFGFRLTGIIMLVTALPLILLMKEKAKFIENTTFVNIANYAFRDLMATAIEARQIPGLLMFFTGRFWYYLAIQTASVIAILFATDTVGLTTSEAMLVLIVGISVAIPFAPLWGKLNDIIGPIRSMNIILFGWVLNILACIAIPTLGLSPNVWWVIGISSGVFTAGVWSTDRPLLTYITVDNGGKSESDIGKFFGLMSVTGRLSTVVGPFAWGLLVVTLGFGQIIGVVFLLISALISVFCLYAVKRELKGNT